MDLTSIFREFQALETVTEKVTYLRAIATLNLPYDINYEALIAAWERNENWYKNNSKISGRGPWQSTPTALEWKYRVILGVS